MRPEVSASLKWRCWSGCHNSPKKSCWHRCCSSAFCISFFRFLSPPFCSACANCCCSRDRRATLATATRGGFGTFAHSIARERSGVPASPICVSRAHRSAKRCAAEPGTVTVRGDPGSAVHRYALSCADLSRCASRCTASGTPQAGVQTRIRIEPHAGRSFAERLSGGLGAVGRTHWRCRRTTAGLMSMISTRQTKYDRAQLWLPYLFRRLRGREPLHNAFLFFRPLFILPPYLKGKDAHFADDSATAPKLLFI